MYWPTIISVSCAALSCGYAVWRNNGLERLAALLILLDWMVSLLVASHDFNHAQSAVFTIDGLLAVALVWIATRTRRFWPLWAAAFQIFELLMHLSMLVDHHVQPRAYFIGIEISSYLILVALVLGAALENPRRPKVSEPNLTET